MTRNEKPDTQEELYKSQKTQYIPLRETPVRRINMRQLSQMVGLYVRNIIQLIARISWDMEDPTGRY